MASYSVLDGKGGDSQSSVFDALSPQSNNLLNSLFGGTDPETIVQTELDNGTQAFVGINSDGEVSVAIIPSLTGTTVGTVTDAGLALTVSLPADFGVAASGINNANPADTSTFLNNIIEAYLPGGGSPATTALANSLFNSVSNVTAGLTQAGANDIILRLIELLRGKSGDGAELSADELGSFQQVLALLDSEGEYPGIDSLVGADHILLDAGSSSGTQLFAINLAGADGRTLGLLNVEAAVLAASGTVKVEDNTPIYIASDNSAQSISGGGGNDTLVGTGNDTLAGGAGSDVFGFSGAGKYVITDFNKTADSFAFDFAGVETIDQLKALVTGVLKGPVSTTYVFGPDTSITLVGVTPSEVTAEMIKLTINNSVG